MSENKKRQYPESVESVLDEHRKYNPVVLKAMRRYKNRKPWRGTLVERVEKLRLLHRALCKHYKLSIGLVIDVPEPALPDGNGVFIPEPQPVIIITGKLSVLTYLHEFAHARYGDGDEAKACGWSVNLYKRVFPKSWSRMAHVAHRVIKPEAAR